MAATPAAPLLIGGMVALVGAPGAEQEVSRAAAGAAPARLTKRLSKSGGSCARRLAAFANPKALAKDHAQEPAGTDHCRRLQQAVWTICAAGMLARLAERRQVREQLQCKLNTAGGNDDAQACCKSSGCRWESRVTASSEKPCGRANCAALGVCCHGRCHVQHCLRNARPGSGC